MICSGELGRNVNQLVTRTARKLAGASREDSWIIILVLGPFKMGFCGGFAIQQLRGGINNQKYLLVENFHQEGDPPPPPHDLVEKTQVIFFGLRTTNGGLLWIKSFFPLEKLKILKHYKKNLKKSAWLVQAWGGGGVTNVKKFLCISGRIRPFRS